MSSSPKQQIQIPPAVIDLGIVLLLLFLRIYASWMEWVDLVVDFGRELYVPWRITQGAALYRDIAWFSGPFSAYFNSLAFSLGGVSVTTLVVANIFVCVTAIVLLYFILREIASRLAAVAGCCAFVFLFSCGTMLGFGLFNWMAPYSHDLTHGFTLAAAAILSLLKFTRRTRLSMLISCGIFCGLTFLTKPEIFLALFAAVAGGVLLTYLPKTGRPPLRWLAFFAGSLAAPVLLAVAILSLCMPLATALHGVFGGWASVFNSRLTTLPFYQWLRGTDDPALQLRNIGIALLITVSIIAGSAAGAWFLAPRLQSKNMRVFSFTTFGLITFVLLLPLLVTITPGHLDFAAGVLLPVSRLVEPLWLALRVGPVPQPFPIFLAALLVLQGYWLFRRPVSISRTQIIARIILLVFALVMLAKIILFVRFEHYSFVLNVAGTLVLIAALLDWLPPLLVRSGSPTVFRAVMLVLIVLVVAARCPPADIPQMAYHIGHETFYAHRRFAPVNDAVAYLQTHSAPAQTVAVLPEGAMINFLARRANSTAYVNTLPLEYLMYGSHDILASFAAHPPDFILLMHRPTPEYGTPFFGKDYAPELLVWIRGHYHQAALFGDPPLQSRDPKNFGIEILTRNPPTTEPPS